eukprot:TRINITY_DN17143_c0_g1_i1.p1 TRINITY_DN17143_c0_g1~~TRINITY_DN17143_c0_g1_i1.p1  ORF type:complete len:220 (-),score=50.70 TRINITY_DN17143_c0_g1_i1:59-697(-)
MARSAGVAFHALGATSGLCAVGWVFVLLTPTLFWRTAMFWTMWSLYAQAALFVWALLRDLFRGPRPRHTAGATWFDVAALIVFCMECSTFALFWALYLANPALVFRGGKNHIPFFLNQLQHTIAPIFAALELLVCGHNLIGSFLHEVATVYAVAVAYATIVCSLFLVHGWWPYPIMNTPIGFAVACVLFALLLAGCVAAARGLRRVAAKKRV